MFTKTTEGIKVTVMPNYLADQSEPADDYYVWSYTVTVENHSPHIVQLLTRHWHITDAQGLVQEVRGSGVVGEQPVLKPGEAFRYTSGTNLATPSGIMQGSYQMATEDGRMFDVTIPAFSLDSPAAKIRMN